MSATIWTAANGIAARALMVVAALTLALVLAAAVGVLDPSHASAARTLDEELAELRCIENSDNCEG
jgi:hypothetical protein